MVKKCCVTVVLSVVIYWRLKFSFLFSVSLEIVENDNLLFLGRV
jgi:hypothetical protein